MKKKSIAQLVISNSVRSKEIVFIEDKSYIPTRNYLACSYVNEDITWETGIDDESVSNLLEQLNSLPPEAEDKVNLLDGYGFYLQYNQHEYSWNTFSPEIPTQLRIVAEKLNKLAGDGGQYFDCRF